MHVQDLMFLSDHTTEVKYVKVPGMSALIAVENSIEKLNSYICIVGV